MRSPALLLAEARCELARFADLADRLGAPGVYEQMQACVERAEMMRDALVDTCDQITGGHEAWCRLDSDLIHANRLLNWLVQNWQPRHAAL